VAQGPATATRTALSIVFFTASFLAAAAHSSPIRFVFTGRASGSVAGTPFTSAIFTASGTVTDETDVYPGDCCGAFVTDQVLWDFGGGNTFLTDDGAMIFTQEDFARDEVNFIQNSLQINDGMLYDAGSIYSNTFDGTGGLYTDSNVLQAVGLVQFTGQGGLVLSYSLSNSAGRTMTLSDAQFISLVTTAIPEPPSAMLLAVGIVGLAAQRGRAAAARRPGARAGSREVSVG
jgi:hypothetical protein